MSNPIPLTIIGADELNDLRRRVNAARPLPGVDVALQYSPNGTTISVERTPRFSHPWQLSVFWRAKPDGSGEWRATVRPGFVNGRDVTIHDELENDDGKLVKKAWPTISEPAPSLVLDGWRDPTVPLSLGATDSGKFTQSAGEGYPKFFDTLGVKPAATAGTVGHDDVAEDRTRLIRAMDIVLVTPRLATRQTASADQGFVEIDTVFLNDAIRSAESAHWLQSRSKFVPAIEPTALDRLMGTAVESQLDELKLATVWLVSPPDAPDGDDVQPDSTWTPYPQHFVFWNLNHASRAQIPKAPQPPLRLVTGLAFGIADTIFESLLSPINTGYSQVNAYLGAGDFKGEYWVC